MALITSDCDQIRWRAAIEELYRCGSWPANRAAVAAAAELKVSLPAKKKAAALAAAEAAALGRERAEADRCVAQHSTFGTPAAVATH